MPTEPISAAPAISGAWYAINTKKENSDEVEVLIYDVIGAWGISADRFVRDFKAIDAKRIVIGINSPGGGVDDGTAIYNAIKSHPAYVTTRIDGTAASAASFIAAAGDTVRMADNTYFMIHDASGGVMGGSEDMRRFADLLEKVNDNIAGMYEKKTGKDRKYWRDKMSAETWFNAEEAKAEGLVDEVFAASKAPEKAKAAFDFKIYNKIPDAVKAMWGISNSTSQPAPESSQRSEPPQALTQEVSPMAETTTQAPPASNPAAGSGSNVTQGNTIDAAEARAREIERLKGQTAEATFNQGRAKGIDDGRAQERERLKAIVAVCPGKSDMAIGAFLSGQSPEAVKLAFDESSKVEAAAKTREDELRLETERWRNLAATGGYPGGVDLGISQTSEGSDEPEMDPKAQAEAEWDHKPAVRKGYTSKANYVAYRKRELKGTVSISK